MSSKSPYAKLGESALNNMETVNAEIFSMMYGSLVTQLLRDYKDISIVNGELFKIGYNMGIRMIEEFLARSNIPACSSFRDTMTALAEAGFKMFLGLNAEVRSVTPPDERCFRISFSNNPLSDFVELPPSCAGLQYSIILCGAITGALRSMHMVVDCEIVSDELKGDPTNEIKITLKDILREQYKDEED